MKTLEEISLFAWVGEDEFGSGEIGIRQVQVPAGIIPIVAIEKEKIDKEYIVKQMKVQSSLYNKKIQLCEFIFKRVVTVA